MHARDNLIAPGGPHIIDHEPHTRKCRPHRQQRLQEPIAPQCHAGPIRMLDEIGRQEGIEQCRISRGKNGRNTGIEAANEIDIRRGGFTGPDLLRKSRTVYLPRKGRQRRGAGKREQTNAEGKGD
jgi:hypothetical protein